MTAPTIPSATLFLMGLFPVIAASAFAADVPIRKAGEWEVSLGNGMMAPMSKKICVTSDKPITEMLNGNMRDCANKTVSVSGGTVTVDMSCAIRQGMSVTVHGTITQVGTDAYHSESTAHFQGAPAGMPADMTITGEARRLGPCQPGDEQRP